MKVAFVGGGTGGHLAPGIGVAEVLREAGHESLFLVAGRTVEYAMLEPRGFACRSLFSGTGGRPRVHRMREWWRATRALRRELGAFDPDVVVVLGGWVALPTVWSRLGSRPTVLIESNARPGRVQRLLGRRIDHACLAVDAPGMPRGRRTTRVTGVPTPELGCRSRDEALQLFGLDPERRTLLVTGGSQGAQDLNTLVPALRDVLAAHADRWQILHISGNRSCAEAATGRVTFDAAALTDGDGLAPVAAGGPVPTPVAEVPVERRAFIADMAAAWAVADVAVCRAGAGTVAELASTGTPALLIPYPHHADRHQAWNGRLLVDAGAAVMVGASDPTGAETAVRLFEAMLDRLPEMASRASGVARPDAARLVAQIVGAAGRHSS